MRFLAPSLDLTGYGGSVVWCGPAAMSFLTGLPVRVSHARLSAAMGERYQETEGVHVPTLLMALKAEGLHPARVDTEGLWPGRKHGPSLATFAGDFTAPDLLLIHVPSHFIVGHCLSSATKRLADNWTRKPVAPAAFPKPGRVVLDVYRLSPRL